MLNEIENKIKKQTVSSLRYNDLMNSNTNTIYNNEQETLSKKYDFNKNSTNFSSNLNFHVSDKSNEMEIRKILEREVEPYLFSVKSELKLTMDNFLKEIGEFKHIANEVNQMKQSINENRKLVLIFQEDFDKKLVEIKMKTSNAINFVENNKSSIEDSNRKMKNLEDKISIFNDNFKNTNINQNQTSNTSNYKEDIIGINEKNK